jgi:hypothetical protein
MVGAVRFVSLLAAIQQGIVLSHPPQSTTSHNGFFMLSSTPHAQPLPMLRAWILASNLNGLFHAL